MEKKITLRKPIEINGRKVTELTYDAEEITNDMFLQACAQSAELSKTKTISLKVRENDYALHLYLGYMAIIAVNPDIDIMDLQRIKGKISYKLWISVCFLLCGGRRKPQRKATPTSNPGIQQSFLHQRPRTRTATFN